MDNSEENYGISDNELTDFKCSNEGFRITDKVIRDIEILSGLGLTTRQLHGYFGVSAGTWANRRAKYPQIDVAFHRGKSKQIAHVSQSLQKQINSGNVTAMIFYLKTQAGWKEDNSAAEDEKINAPSNVTFNVNDPIEAAKVYQQLMKAGKP